MFAAVLNFQSDGIAYLDFVTDKYKFNRGFKAVFQQLPCLARYRTKQEEQEAAPYPPAGEVPDNQLDRE